MRTILVCALYLIKYGSTHFLTLALKYGAETNGVAYFGHRVREEKEKKTFL